MIRLKSKISVRRLGQIRSAVISGIVGSVVTVTIAAAMNVQTPLGTVLYVLPFVLAWVFLVRLIRDKSWFVSAIIGCGSSILLLVAVPCNWFWFHVFHFCWPAPLIMGCATGLLVRLAVPNEPDSTSLRCGTCSYNLFGNVSGTCPECGTKISKYDGGPSKEKGESK